MTDEQLVEKYSKLCTHIAWSFVTKANHTKAQPFAKRGGDHQEWDRRLTAVDAEDFAADALMKLLRCPQQYRTEHSYVLRLIINTVINSHKKRSRVVHYETRVGGNWDLEGEWEQPAPLEKVDPYDFAAHDIENLDFSSLTEPELTVLRLHFGLDGAEGLSEKVIARKLGRTQWWVQTRLRQGLQKLRQSTIKNT